MPDLPKNRFNTMKGKIPLWLGSLEKTCEQFDYHSQARQHILQAFFDLPLAQNSEKDPTNYHSH